MKTANKVNVIALTKPYSNLNSTSAGPRDKGSEGTNGRLRRERKSQAQADEGAAQTAAQSALADGLALDDAPQPVEGDFDFEIEESSRGPSEDDLIKKSLAGDQDAFEVLVRRHTGRVFNIIGSFFRRRDMVEDIAQEVFAKAFFSLRSFTIGRSFEAWVAKIAVNACYDHLRAQRRRIEYQMPRNAEQEDDWLELQMLEAATERHASAERQRDAVEISERLLSRLDPEDRLVLVLIDRDGYSVKDVAEMTGWGQSKIKVRAFRARRTLRAAMKRLMLSAERKQRNNR